MMGNVEKFKWFKAGFMIDVGAPAYHKELKICDGMNDKEIMDILCCENVQKIIQLSFVVVAEVANND